MNNIEQFHLPACQSCGGEYQHISENKYVCKNCGNTHYINNPLSSQNTSASIREGTILRNDGDFDKAERHFMDVIERSSNSADLAEAYWGRFLCEYGIMHVHDSKTGKYMPTACQKISSTEIKNDPYYKKALSFCDSPLRREEYEKDAEYIENIRLRQLEEAKKEPFQIFICHKKSAGENSITNDYLKSQEIYEFLTEKGFKVFFADKSLKGSVGSAYEAKIFTALATSKVMLVVGSSKENLNAPWVRNEWTRFLYQMEYEHEKSLIPVFIDGMQPRNLPEELRKIQGLEYTGKFFENLLERLEVIFKNDRARDIKTKNIITREGKKAEKIAGVDKRTFSKDPQSAKKLLIQQERDIDVAFKYLGDHAYNDAKYVLTKQIEKNDEVDEIVDFGLKMIVVAPKLVKANFNLSLDESVFSAFNEAVKGAPDSSREIIFNYFKQFTFEALKVSNITWGIKCYNTIMEWDYPGRDRFDDEVRDLCYSWLDKTSDVLLNNYTLLMHSILKFDEGGIDNYLSGLATCADNVIKAGEKEAGIPNDRVRHHALSFYEAIVKHNEGDYKTRWKIILLKTGTTKEKFLKNVIANFDAFDAFQEMLEFTPEDKRHGYIDTLINSIIGGLREFFAHKSNQKVDHYLDLFDRAIAFTSKQDGDYLRQKLYEIAHTCQGNFAFDHAITYYNMIVREKADEYDAYWGLLQCKTGSRTDEELIAQKKPIHRLKDFQNAYQAAGSNKEKIDYYLEVKNKQGKHTVSMGTEKRFKRNKAYAIICLFLAIASLVLGGYAAIKAMGDYSIETDALLNLKYPVYLVLGGSFLVALILAIVGLKQPPTRNKAKIIINVITTLFVVCSMFASVVGYKTYTGFKILLNHDGKVTEYTINPYTNEISFIPLKDGKQFIGWADESGDLFISRGKKYKDYTWNDDLKLFAVWSDVQEQTATTSAQVNEIVQQQNTCAEINCSNLPSTEKTVVSVPSYLNNIKITGNNNTIDLSFVVESRTAPITFEFENVVIYSENAIISSDYSVDVNIIATASALAVLSESLNRTINVNGNVNIVINEEGFILDAEGQESMVNFAVANIVCNDLSISGANGGGTCMISGYNNVIKASIIDINCEAIEITALYAGEGESQSEEIEFFAIECQTLNVESGFFVVESYSNNLGVLKAANANIKYANQMELSSDNDQGAIISVDEKLAVEYVEEIVSNLVENTKLCEMGAIECGELSLNGGNYSIFAYDSFAVKANSVNVKAEKLEISSVYNSTTLNLIECQVFNAEVGVMNLVSSTVTTGAGGSAICANDVNMVISNTAKIVGGKSERTGSAGGDAIVANNISIDGESTATIEVYGGDAYYNSTSTGSTGVDGGKGGNAFCCSNIIKIKNVNAHIYAGKGGMGGAGVYTSTRSDAPAAKGQHNKGDTDGYTGDTGYTGYTGTKGQKGGNSGRAIVQAQLLEIIGSANVHLYEAESGTGGTGGTGGKGGKGGKGGAGTDAALFRNGSNGGNGGRGGTGGTGGPGGDAGMILNATESTLTVSFSLENGASYSKHKVTASGGGGAPGAGGPGGDGGAGGRAGDGVFETYRAGYTGATGYTGSNGTTYGASRTHE